MWAQTFPGVPASDVRAAAGSLGPTTLAPSGAFTAVVTGRRVEIPYRIYHAVPGPEARSVLTARQLLILDCLLTRHHDGFVRQRAASRILPADRPCVAPFVVHLIGEYVVEIVATIAAELAVGDVRLALYREFARANQGLIALVRARAISYWNCYYRRAWPSFDDYPARALLDRLR